MVPKEQVEQLIEKSNGKFFSVSFVKRTTGEVRNMTARTGVTSHLKGGKQAYKPADKQLQVVFDVQKQAYRSIPLDAVIEFKCRVK